MSRIIKFRAWDKEKKKMISYDTDCYCPCMTLNGVLQSPDLHSNISYKYKIMQFTGLSDKNGKEIYEEDILKEVMVGKVEYWRNEFVAVTKMGSTFTPGEDCEIIGNRFENPELWEEQGGKAKVEGE